MADVPSRLTEQVTKDLKSMLSGPARTETLTHALRHLAKWRSHLIENTLVAREGDQILSGPFKGMKYAVRASEGARISRLLGCYEATLVPVIEQIIAQDYRTIIDIGSAEGYYAVGLALRMPNARILARDDDSTAQDRCRKLAETNDVSERVEIGGRVEHTDFADCASQPTVVICDIEGGEHELLDPAKAPGLRDADILVECHERLKPGVTETLISRFASSHRITRLDRATNSAALPDWMDELNDLDRALALWEWRGGPTPWLWMTRHG